MRQLRLPSVLSELLHAAVWCAVLVGVAYGQTSQGQVDEVLSQKVRSVIEHLKQGVYGPATQEQIAEGEAGQLVPILEARFVTSQDADVKGRVARALADLGDRTTRTGTFWCSRRSWRLRAMFRLHSAYR
ncbi:hypothetical protein [Tunturiibacter lichenicola]|uniref:hypothetical protein n=1 Tax=Tunturiibacter lichenicola TaxID=2051959 RepID=UPI003D9BF9BA